MGNFLGDSVTYFLTNCAYYEIQPNGHQKLPTRLNPKARKLSQGHQ